MHAEILHLFVSPEHSFVGHFGKKPGAHPMTDLDQAECVAGLGLVGDRYFNRKPNNIGQVTFFDIAVHQDLLARLGFAQHASSVYRRNIVVRGLDLNMLIGRVFELQGVRFEGTEEASPCGWMDEVCGPGAKDALKGRGGLRAKVLRGGSLKKGAAVLKDCGPSNGV